MRSAVIIETFICQKMITRPFIKFFFFFMDCVFKCIYFFQNRVFIFNSKEMFNQDYALIRL